LFGRREKWWVRELERRERAWQVERASLVKTICHLAGKPLPVDSPLDVEPVPDPDWEADLVAPEYLTLP
jgi:hypothetical protein